MLIRDMFVKKIDRDIKGVIKVGQGDDANVKQELEEYVVTRELQKHFADFFSSYKKGINGNTDKMGVWISGFFGSGKSHFLKILSYLLENRVVDGKSAIDYFIDDRKIKDEVVLADMKLASKVSNDTILFNIDSKSGMADSQNNKEAILLVFLKVFNQHMGYYGSNPHIADLERQLDEENIYDKFKETFAKIRGKSWNDSRHHFRFVQDKVCEALVEIGFMSMESAKNWCETSTKDYNIDVSTFAEMVKRHIDNIGNNHHVIFLVDEIGQYIGEDSKLMLNLQTVVEDLGAVCGGKAWVIVTSQQNIDQITKAKGDNFSKITGRFDTKLSLSSANVDEVIRKRILDKTQTAKQTLKLLYDEKDTILKNLLIFNDGIEKKLYTDRDNFSAVYPFIPYQFNLLGNVLTSIRQHGASGKHLAEGERSMLALFKESAMRIKDKEEGALTPFNSFYDALEQFLDHSHKGVIIKAYDNEYINPEKREDCFEVNVLKTLFLIKYVKEIVANVENITTLMIKDIDDDRIELKTRVEDALTKLTRQTLVQKNGETYVFLTDEEQEINREIKNQNVENSEVIGKISEQIFDGLYSEKRYRYPAFNGRYTFAFNQFVDERPYKANQNFDMSLKIITPNYENAIDETKLRLLSGQEKSVIVVLPEDKSFVDEFRIALKIEKYIRLSNSNAISKYEEIKIAKRAEMAERNKNARMFLEESLKNSEIYLNGDKLQCSSKEISNKITEAFKKLVDTTFHKLSYIEMSVNEANIKAILRGDDDSQIRMDSSDRIANKLAIDDVLDFIMLNSQRHSKTSLKSIIERYTKAPYGFIEDDIQWIVAKLFKDGDVALHLNNETLSLTKNSADEIFRYLSRREFVEKLLIDRRKRVNEEQKKSVRSVMKELFNTVPSGEDEDAIFKSFHQYTQSFKSELERLEIYYQNEPKYPGKKTVSDGKALLIEILTIQDNSEFFALIHKKQDEIKGFVTAFDPVKSFFDGEQKKIWDKALHNIRIYDQSKSFIVNKELENVVAEIHQILKNNMPYNEIRKLPALLEQFMTLYIGIMEKEEKPIYERIEAERKNVFYRLEEKPYKEKYVPKVLKDFDELKEKAKTCNNIATLQNVKLEANAIKCRYFDEIKKEDKIIGPGPKPKPEINMSIKSLTKTQNWRIETEADIDNFIDELKENLKEELLNGVINLKI